MNEKAKTLKELRLEKKLSQLEVAKKIGKNERGFANLDKGISKLQLLDAAKLAYVYGVDLDTIFIANLQTLKNVPVDAPVFTNLPCCV